MTGTKLREFHTNGEGLQFKSLALRGSACEEVQNLKGARRRVGYSTFRTKTGWWEHRKGREHADTERIISQRRAESWRPPDQLDVAGAESDQPNEENGGAGTRRGDSMDGKRHHSSRSPRCDSFGICFDAS
jgi:hypothetical protein